MKKLLFLLIITILSVKLSAEDFPTGKDPLKAALYSFTIPGAGQFYNEKKTKALIVIGIEASVAGMTIYHHNKMITYKNRLDHSITDEERANNQFYYNDYFEKRQSDYWWLGTSIFLSAIDAFVDAHLNNFDEKKKEIDLRFSENKVVLSVKF